MTRTDGRMDFDMQNAIIKSTQLGIGDHGESTFWVMLEYAGGGQGFGGRCNLTMEQVVMVLNALGVQYWEDLPGKHVRALQGHTQVVAIGDIIEDSWVQPTDDGDWVVGKMASLPCFDLIHRDSPISQVIANGLSSMGEVIE